MKLRTHSFPLFLLLRLLFVYLICITSILKAKDNITFLETKKMDNTLNVELFFEKATCVSNNGKAWIEVSESTNPYTTLWSTGESNTDTIYNLASGDYKVSITNGLDEVILSGTLEMEMPYELEWTKVYGGSEDDIAFDVELTLDGGYIVVGESESNDGDISNSKGGTDFWVIKLDEQGELEWEKSYGGSMDDGAKSVVVTSDGHYIIAGYSRSDDGDVSSPLGGNDYWVIKIDENGTLLWNKNYGGSDNEKAYEIDSTSDGKFLVIGTARSVDGDIEGQNDYNTIAWIMKIDGNGTLLWDQGGGGRNIYGRYIASTLDNGHISGGDTYWDDTNAWIRKSNSLGEAEWLIGFYEYDLANYSYAIELTPDGHYLIIGSRWLLKLNELGEIIWQNIEVGNNAYEGAGEDVGNDQDVILIGEKKIVVSDNDTYYILDEFGTTQKTVSYGGSSIDKSIELKPTSGGGFIAVGYSKSDDGDVGVNYGAKDFWIIKHSQIHFPEINLEASRLVCNNETIELAALDTLCFQCTYLWNDGNTDSIRLVTITEDISYQVTITSPTGCFARGNIDIITSDISLPEIIFAPVSEIDCEHPSITIDGSASTGSEFIWTTSDGYSCVNEMNNPILEVCLAGTYCLTAVENTSASTSCEVTECITIIENSTLEVDLEIVAETCAAMNATATILNASGNYSYQWCNGQTTATAEGLSPGDCSVTITDNNACTIIKVFEVGQIDLPITSFDVQDVVCEESNGTIDAIATGAAPFLYQWSNGDTTASISNLGEDIYNLTLTDANNCTVVSDVAVVNLPFSKFDVDIVQTMCNQANGSIEVSANTFNLNYVWNTGETGPDLYNLPGGEYMVTITNQLNCVEFKTYTVQGIGQPSIDLGPDLPIESGQTLTLGMEQSNVNYLWSTNETSPTIEVTNPGLYSVTVTKLFNCTASDEIEIFSLTETEDLNQNEGIRIFPNPVTQYLNIGYQDINPQELSIKIYNVGGQILKETKKHSTSGDNHCSIDVHHFPKGIYLLKIENKERVEVIKFIKM